MVEGGGEDALKAQKKKESRKEGVIWILGQRSLLRRSQAPQVLPCVAKASYRLSTSRRTVQAAATTTTKGEIRVNQALEVEATIVKNT